MTRHGGATVTTPSDREILITRTFDAPAARVFDAWTTPEHVRQWWGSDDAPMVECDIDLRVGGAWRYVTRGTDGTEFAWHGTYREVERPGRLVSTEVFEGFPDAEAVNTATLTEDDGTTTLTVTVLHSSKENRDGHLNSGMEAGMQVVLDRLEDLVRS
ncbi:MAG: SRPBCC family protein [Geodermatophilaceae bacterium]|nr:SRPBCC family protein [Geodermatophilaceae bacterium]